MTQSVVDEGNAIPMDQVYAKQMRVHAIMLIWLGYRRLNAASLGTADEDAITGELKRAMKEVTQDCSSPNWVDSYEIAEQTRQNVGQKLGKKRPIMDIEMERHCRGTRPRLGFEAKLLKRGKTVGAYLGDKGLAAFIGGYYKTTHGDAGMLAFFQEKTSMDWSTKLAQALLRKSKKHRIAEGRQLKRFDAENDMPAFCSGHTGLAGNSLFIMHVFLPFVCDGQ